MYYILNYSDYNDLPSTLFCGNTQGKERKSIDGTKFIVHCKCHRAGHGCLSWISKTEQSYSHDELIHHIDNSEWQSDED